MKGYFEDIRMIQNADILKLSEIARIPSWKMLIS